MARLPRLLLVGIESLAAGAFWPNVRVSKGGRAGHEAFLRVGSGDGSTASLTGAFDYPLRKAERARAERPCRALIRMGKMDECERE